MEPVTAPARWARRTFLRTLNENVCSSQKSLRPAAGGGDGDGAPVLRTLNENVCSSQNSLRPAAGGDQRSVVVPGGSAPLLGLGAPSLGLDPPRLRALGRPGRRAGRLHPQSGVEPGGESRQGQLTVARLGARVRSTGPHHRSEALEEPGPLARAEGRRRHDVELHLHPAECAVGVLSTRAPGGGGAPGDLRQGQVEPPVHVQGLAGGHGAIVGGAGYAP